MPVLLGGKLRPHVLVGGKCVVYHMCDVACLECVRLPMVTMNMLLGRNRA
jgi:hypothetical protein